MTLRLGFTFIPAWQLSLNIILQTLVALGSLWPAAHLFRLGMLQYGRRLSLRQIFYQVG